MLDPPDTALSGGQAVSAVRRGPQDLRSNSNFGNLFNGGGEQPRYMSTHDREALFELQRSRDLQHSFNDRLCCSWIGAVPLTVAMAHIAPHSDGQDVALTSWLMAVGALSTDQKERNLQRGRITNNLPLEMNFNAAIDLPGGSLICFLPTHSQMQSVLHATLNFLRQEEQRQEPLRYWTMDMDLLRASFEGGQCGDQKTFAYDVHMLALPEDSGHPFFEFVKIYKGSGERQSFSIAHEDVHKLPLRYTSESVAGGKELTALPWRWLFLDPIIVIARATATLHRRRLWSWLRKDFRQIACMASFIARLVESPFPSFYRTEGMLKLAGGFGLSLDALGLSESQLAAQGVELNFAPRVYHLPEVIVEACLELRQSSSTDEPSLPPRNVWVLPEATKPSVTGRRSAPPSSSKSKARKVDRTTRLRKLMAMTCSAAMQQAHFVRVAPDRVGWRSLDTEPNISLAVSFAESLAELRERGVESAGSHAIAEQWALEEEIKDEFRRAEEQLKEAERRLESLSLVAGS